MGNFAENLNLGNRVRPPPCIIIIIHNYPPISIPFLKTKQNKTKSKQKQFFSQIGYYCIPIIIPSEGELWLISLLQNTGKTKQKKYLWCHYKYFAPNFIYSQKW